MRFMDAYCKNCNRKSNLAFCPNCGQKMKIERFTIKLLMSEAIHAFTHADRSFLVLLKNLIIHPGKVAADYIVHGKRKNHFNIFTFFVLITTIAAFVERQDLSLKEELFHFDNDFGFQMNIYSKLLYLVEIPILAFLLWIIYRKITKLYYSEYTVFAMLILSVSAIYLIVIKLLNLVLTKLSGQNIAIDDHWFYAVLLVLIGTYITYDFHKNIGLKKTWSPIPGGLIFLVVHASVSIFIVWSLFRNFSGLGIFDLFGIRISG